jgi:fructokinase
LGQKVGLLAGISTDMLGRKLQAHLASEGVDSQYLVHSDRSTTLSLVATSSAGIPSYAFYGEGAADRHVSISDVPALADALTAIHIGSYALVLPPIADTIETLVRRERQRRLISLDPNIRPTVEPDMAVWRRRVDVLLPLVDVVKASEEDLAALYPNRYPDDVAVQWSKAGPRLVVLTRGASGATTFHRNGIVSRPAHAVAVVDTVGAGDAFQAALLSSLAVSQQLSRDSLLQLTRSEVERHLDYAITAAGDACTRCGADLPTNKRIDEAIASRRL